MVFWNGPIMVLEQIANLSLGVIRVLSSSLSRSAKFWSVRIEVITADCLSAYGGSIPPQTAKLFRR